MSRAGGVRVLLARHHQDGKDTITAELHKLDSRYVLFPRLKVGSGRTAGYRMTSRRELATLRAHGEIIYENQRYDAVVYPWCPRDIAVERIAARGSDDLTVRLSVWDATRPLPDAHLTINTAEAPADQAAQQIHECLKRLGHPSHA